MRIEQMKKMKKNSWIILLLSFLSGCSIQVSKTTPYEEPAVSSSYAVIKLKNVNEIEHFIGEVIRKPNNKLRFYKIDNQRLSFLSSDTIRVSPGVHHVMITCSTTNRQFGEAILTINAMPGRTYEIAYPDYMYGYEIDYTACQKLIVR
jgi:hypothetical protein